MKKIIVFMFGVFMFGVSIFFNPGSSALAAPSYPKSDLTCTNTTMIGQYGFQATGNILPGGKFPPGLFVTGGYYKFDGQGNVNGSYYVSFNGNIVEYPDATGTYKVDENCTLDMTIKNSDAGGTYRIGGQIVKKGEEALLIDLVPYTAITTVMKKVN